MEKKSYSNLTINQKINYKSGWDIAISREGENGYCKMQKCIKANVPFNSCLQDYSGRQKRRFFNGERTLHNRTI